MAPINWAGAPILAYNLVLLSSFVLCGLGATLWIRELTGSTAAGFVGGLIWAFAPARLDHLAHIQLLTGQWIPFALWALTRYVDTGRRSHLLFAALFLSWQYWTAIQLTLLTLPLLALYLLALLALRGDEAPASGARIPLELGLAAALVVAAAIPISIPYLQVSEAEGFQRSIADTYRFSAQPTSLLAPAAANRAGHMRALNARFRTLEANYFPGLLAAALVLIGMVQVVGRRGRLWRATAATPPGRGPPVTLRRAHRAAVVAIGVVAALTISGLVASGLGAPSTNLALRIAAATDPVAWLAVLATAALLTWRPTADLPMTARRHIVVLTVALLGYLLATGPVVRGWGSDLGSGPFRILYDWVLPYRSIRAVGRFGIPMMLFLSAGAGFGVAALERRLADRPRWRQLGALLLILGLVLEYRVSPLPTHDAVPADRTLYRALRDLPGDGGVLHLPMHPNDTESESTEYMLGSTLHWRPLANGYSGFLPTDSSDLLGLTPFTTPFYRHLRQHFPVDYIVVHGRSMDTVDPGWRERLDSVLPGAGRYVEVAETTNEGLLLRLRRDTEGGTSFIRRYALRQLDGVEAVRFEARAPDAPARLELVWDRKLVGGFDVFEQWQHIEVERPAAMTGLADGTVTLQWKSVPAERMAVGTTGAYLGGEILVEAQRDFVGVALDDLWLTRRRKPGFLIAVLTNDGRRPGQSRYFSVRQAPAFAALVASLPQGTMVACALSLPSHGLRGQAESAVLEALTRLGAATRSEGLGGARALLGVVGAGGSSALIQTHPARASLRIGPVAATAPRVVVRGIERLRR